MSKQPDVYLVVAFRNVLAQGYAMLEHGRVFRIAVERAAHLLRVLQELSARYPEDSLD